MPASITERYINKFHTRYFILKNLSSWNRIRSFLQEVLSNTALILMVKFCMRRRAGRRTDFRLHLRTRRERSSRQAALADEHDARGDTRRTASPARRLGNGGPVLRRALPLGVGLAHRHERHARRDAAHLARERAGFDGRARPDSYAFAHRSAGTRHPQFRPEGVFPARGGIRPRRGNV